MSELSLPPQFTTALQSLHRWLEDNKIPYTIIGGVAVSLIAQPRATQDIDACVWLESEDLSALLESGQKYDYVPRITDVLSFAKRARVLLLEHETTGTKADISMASLPFEREMISRASIVRAGDVELRIPRAEDLIVLKAVAHRPRDIADIESILTTHDDLDLNWIIQRTEEFALVLESPEILADLKTTIRRVGK